MEAELGDAAASQGSMRLDGPPEAAYEGSEILSRVSERTQPC